MNAFIPLEEISKQPGETRSPVTGSRTSTRPVTRARGHDSGEERGRRLGGQTTACGALPPARSSGLPVQSPPPRRTWQRGTADQGRLPQGGRDGIEERLAARDPRAARRAFCHGKPAWIKGLRRHLTVRVRKDRPVSTLVVAVTPKLALVVPAATLTRNATPPDRKKGVAERDSEEEGIDQSRRPAPSNCHCYAQTKEDRNDRASPPPSRCAHAFSFTTR